MSGHLIFQSNEVSASNLTQIASLMSKIQQATLTVSQTFEQTILRHEEQFIKTYKIKIYQLTKLFHQLKKNIQDKFINNAITQQLETIIKERDYFKYQCLKLNTQYKNVLQDYKNLTQQMVNVSEQMNIYKHLLQNQKIKFSQIEKNSLKLKHNLSQLASKTIHDANFRSLSKQVNSFSEQQKQQITKLKKQLKEKSQTIRALKGKLQQYDQFFQQRFNVQEQKKQLQDVFKWCVQSWKREILSKSRKLSLLKHSNLTSVSSPQKRGSMLSFNNCSAEQFNSMQKKQLLQMLFTHPQFLQFVERMLFDRNFEVRFLQIPNSVLEKNQQILIKNRNRLYEVMKKKGLLSSVVNKPFKFR